MASVNRFITYELPAEKTYNYIKLYESTSETGSFSLTSSISYTYGTKATQFTLDTTKWYKIKFYDSTSDSYSPFTQAVYGERYDERELLAAVGNSFDGAGYASLSDFYTITRSSSTTIPASSVMNGLRVGRAFIDLVTGDQTPYRFSRYWGPDTTRRKYNAELELIKTAEVYFSAALCYQDLSDDRTLQATAVITIPPSDLVPQIDLSGINISPVSGLIVDETGLAFSIGNTSINMDGNAVSAANFNLQKELMIAKYNQEKELNYATWNMNKNLQYMEALSNRYLKEAEFFNNLAIRYATRADSIMETFKPSHVPIRYGETTRRQKFLDPGDIFSFAIANVDTLVTTTILDFVIADITGLGGAINDAGYQLTAANMVSNAVDGAFGVAVVPMQNQSTIVQAQLNINGVVYWLDDWTPISTQTVTAGKNGTTGEKLGFSLQWSPDSGDSISVYLEWNYTQANGGFNLTNSDNITLSYIVEE